MRFYRATVTNTKYTKAAPIQTLTCNMGATIIPGKQGDAANCQGRFTSTEYIRPGSIVIGEGQGTIMPLGFMRPYKVERKTGQTGISVYFLTEQGIIAGANG